MIRAWLKPFCEITAPNFTTVYVNDPVKAVLNTDSVMCQGVPHDFLNGSTGGCPPNTEPTQGPDAQSVYFHFDFGNCDTISDHYGLPWSPVT